MNRREFANSLRRVGGRLFKPPHRVFQAGLGAAGLAGDGFVETSNALDRFAARGQPVEDRGRRWVRDRFNRLASAIEKFRREPLTGAFGPPPEKPTDRLRYTLDDFEKLSLLERFAVHTGPSVGELDGENHVDDREASRQDQIQA